MLKHMQWDQYWEEETDHHILLAPAFIQDYEQEFGAQIISILETKMIDRKKSKIKRSVEFPMLSVLLMIFRWYLVSLQLLII